MNDDTISRKATIDAVHSATYGFICGAEDGDEMTETDKLVLSINKAVANAIKALPSAQPQRMRGRWIPQGWNDTYCKCSCCDAVYVTAEIPYNFCSNCGADMRGATNEV